MSLKNSLMKILTTLKIILVVLSVTTFVTVIWCFIMIGLSTILAYFNLPPVILEVGTGVLLIVIITVIINKVLAFH